MKFILDNGIETVGIAARAAIPAAISKERVSAEIGNEGEVIERNRPYRFCR